MIRQNSELQEKAGEDLQLQNAHAEIEKLQRNFDLECQESRARVASLEEEIQDLKEAMSQQESKSNDCW